MRNFFVLLSLLLALFSFDATSIAQDDDPFMIIVNEQNPVVSASKRTVSRWFLKKTTLWEDGTPILPVDLHEGSGIRQSFSAVVHKRNSYSISSYWQRRIFTGAGLPPKTLGSEGQVVDWVRVNRGAIGYVSKETPLEGVKVLRLTE